MMQRQFAGSSRALEEEIEDLESGRGTTYGHRRGHDEAPRSRSSNTKKWIVHCIPLVVFLCLFILWWFSSSVQLVKEENVINSLRSVDTDFFLNESIVELAVSTMTSSSPPSATSPTAAAPEQEQQHFYTYNNPTESVKSKFA